MPLPSEQYAFLAQKIYEPLTFNEEIKSNTHRFNVRYVSPPSTTNYRGAVVRDEATRQLIVVNKGTDPASIHDLVTDIGMGMMGAPPQWPEAAHTMREAMRLAREDRIPVSDISITGHSLGGALAQLQAALPESAGVYAETFNAYGALSMAQALSRHQPLDVASAHERVINRRMHHDPVSAAAKPIGDTVDYMDHRDYQHHKQGGFAPLDEVRSIAASHGIGNFWDRERNQPGAVFAHNYMDDLHRRPLDDLPRGVPLDLSWPRFGEHDRGPTPSAVATAPASSAELDRHDPSRLSVENHALYCALQERIPDAGPKRLMQFTAACHENGITATNLDRIHLDEERMSICFQGKGWLATPAVIGLTQQAPEREQSMQQIREVDQQNMEIAQSIAQSAHLGQRGPVL